MKQFKNLGIEPPEKKFEGKKIGIDYVLNREITVSRFNIGPSKFTDKGNGNRLDMQIRLDDEDRVIFTGSIILMDQIKQVNESDFPFTTTIVKLNPKGYKFT